MIQILCIYPNYKPTIFSFTKQEEVDDFMKDRTKNCPAYEIHVHKAGQVTIGKQIKSI